MQGDAALYEYSGSICDDGGRRESVLLGGCCRDANLCASDFHVMILRWIFLSTDVNQEMIDDLLKWPLTPVVVSGSCGLFFYYANGGFSQASTTEEMHKKSKLPWLTFMVFSMSLAVILTVRFFADVPPDKPQRSKSKKSSQKGGGVYEGGFSGPEYFARGGCAPF